MVPAAEVRKLTTSCGMGVYPGQARVVSTIGGITGVVINPSDPGFVIIFQGARDGGVEPRSGAVSVVDLDLQSEGAVAILNVSPEGGLFKIWGYKRRSVTYYVIDGDGLILTADPAVLVAEGVIIPLAEPVPIPVPTLPSASLAAFMKKKAGKNG